MQEKGNIIKFVDAGLEKVVRNTVREKKRIRFLDFSFTLPRKPTLDDLINLMELRTVDPPLLIA